MRHGRRKVSILLPQSPCLRQRNGNTILIDYENFAELLLSAVPTAKSQQQANLDDACGDFLVTSGAGLWCWAHASWVQNGCSLKSSNSFSCINLSTAFLGLGRVRLQVEDCCGGPGEINVSSQGEALGGDGSREPQLAHSDPLLAR